MPATNRSRLIGAVHVEAKRYRMDDHARRDLMKRVTGKSSCASMSEAQLKSVLNAIRGGKPGPASKCFDDPLKRKIRALWLTLYNLGAVKDRKDSAINAFTEGRVGVSALRMTTPAQDSQIVEALKSWATRAAGVDWNAPGDERTAVVRAQVEMVAPGTSDFYEYLKKEFSLRTHWAAISYKHRDHIIRELGTKIRASKDRVTDK